MADGFDVKIPTPVVTTDLYFLGGGASNARHAFYAVRAGIKGEIKPAEAGTKSIAVDSCCVADPKKFLEHVSST